jgi:hypothetical protein
MVKNDHSGIYMRTFAYVLVLVIVGGAGYAYYHVAYSKCRVPVHYDIGLIDERFALSGEEARAALADAESLWEDATGKNLFTYSQGAAFKVNFIYDERQQNTEEQNVLVKVLDRKAEMSESIREQYETLIASYDTLKAKYQKNVATYERRLAAHNAEVEMWNKKGGAPQEVYESLRRTSNALNAESASLNTYAQQLNTLATRINQVGEKGNAAVEEYNQSVAQFNDRYDTEDEFTQGDYTGNAIHIYQYDDQRELRRVLAHEMGHALSLEHVTDDLAIMHHVFDGTHGEMVLRYDDIREYQRVCGTR